MSKENMYVFCFYFFISNFNFSQRSDYQNSAIASPNTNARIFSILPMASPTSPFKPYINNGNASDTDRRS